MRHNEQAKRLRIILEETNVSQRELSSICKVHPARFSNYVLGKRVIPFEVAYKIMMHHGYSPFWLIFGDGEKKISFNFLSLTDEQLAVSEDIDRDSVFVRQVNESGIRPIVERLLQLDEREQKVFQSIVDRFFPNKYE
ncbi:XRE family transcriptional regulator [Leptospira mayottensis]|uniref:XRE family transcriptional regulator n=2 Tax=Leptospira mayottensis TaxID=1137606 RepID=A0A343US38_9LEPT|nr:helix-turn-helix transcriptional regulator [Leptospira mayottensis]AVH81611.1 XRE family transcriptional regulator [Leptospira mayottensis 200901116]TGN00395.1 XRE family transcriptional regulator [Leptospira mayottensis]